MDLGDLDSAGQQLVLLDANLRGNVAGWRPREPSPALLGHTLTVAELYVWLVERSRVEPFTVAAFDTEPACWHPDGLGGWLKPDAYVKLSTDAVSDHWSSTAGPDQRPHLLVVVLIAKPAASSA